MDVIEKTKIDVVSLLSKSAANQDANEQLQLLKMEEQMLEEKILKFSHEPARRPSKEHKELRFNLNSVRKEIKQTIKAIKKCNALRDAARKIGSKHGNITLNKTKYYW